MLDMVTLSVPVFQSPVCDKSIYQMKALLIPRQVIYCAVYPFTPQELCFEKAMNKRINLLA